MTDPSDDWLRGLVEGLATGAYEETTLSGLSAVQALTCVLYKNLRSPPSCGAPAEVSVASGCCHEHVSSEPMCRPCADRVVKLSATPSMQCALCAQLPPKLRGHHGCRAPARVIPLGPGRLALASGICWAPPGWERRQAELGRGAA